MPCMYRSHSIKNVCKMAFKQVHDDNLLFLKLTLLQLFNKQLQI